MPIARNDDFGSLRCRSDQPIKPIHAFVEFFHTQCAFLVQPIETDTLARRIFVGVDEVVPAAQLVTATPFQLS